MDPGALAGRSCLDLLCSDVDPSLLCRQIEQEQDLLPAQPADLSGYDPDSNADVFYTIESDGVGEALQLCSGTGEAYDKIAALDHYVFRDQESVEDPFGSLISDETAAEYPGGGTEVKNSSSSADIPEPKRRRVAHAPALYVVSGDSAAVPLSSLPAVGASSPPSFHLQFCVSTRGPLGRAPKALGPPASPSLAYFPLGAEDVQVIVMVEPVSQLVPPPPAGPPGASEAGLCPGKRRDFSAGRGLPRAARLTRSSASARGCLSLPGEDAVEPGPEIPPVPPGQVRDRPDPVPEAQRQLKSHFRESCRLAPTARELLLEQLYVDSDLAQCPAEGRGGRGASPRGGDFDAREKARVARGRLLQLPGRPDGGTKVVLVLGKAGMGKSLLLQKLCLDWAGGRWPEFDLVLRFACRSLGPLLGEPCGLRRLLLELSDCGRLEAGEDVYRQVLRRPGKALLLFDGLEALRLPEGPDPPELPESLGGVLLGLLQRKVLPGCTLLLTAQPRDRLPPQLPRADRALELRGFSPQQAELCLARHFQGSPAGGEWLEAVRSRPLLLSHCCSPGLCGLLGDFVPEAGGQGLPATLTGLFLQFLRRRLPGAANGSAPLLPPLAQAAWASSQTPPGALLSRHFPSPEVEAWAVRAGVVRPLPLPPGSPAERALAFASQAVQEFLVALHLALAREVRDKSLTKHLQLLCKARRPAGPSWELVPRFLAGLLFLPEELSAAVLPGEEAEALLAKKQRSLCKYLRRLPVADLGPQKLLELAHCLHETQDPQLLQHLALALRPDLSFRGVPLAPPDAHVLASVLSRSPKRFALDLGQSADLEGLRCLVGLGNVASFRVSLGDAVRLCRRLWEAGQGEQLQAALQKFVMVPFKAETPKDVDDLRALVRLQEELAHGADLPGCSIRAIPAVADLRQLDFSLGPLHGLKGFRKLVEILDAFPRLRHLDLDAQNENGIGDEGVSGLCDVLPRLPSLETLNLSQNKITDRGAELLAQALPSLRLLRSLSMYNNDIGDVGAESMARALPQMASLKVLDIHCNKITAAGAQHLIDSLKACPGIRTVALWNSTIPYGVLKHLQQLDSRIRSL